MKTKSFLLSLLTATTLAWGALSAQATTTVVDFDDLVGVQSGASLTNYQGLNFDENFYSFDGVSDPFNPSSGASRVATDLLEFDVLAESFFSFVSPGQIFVGAFIAGYDFEPVFFNLYRHGTLVATSSTLSPSDAPSFLASGYQGRVDSVGVVGLKGYFSLDDVTYNVPDASLAFGLLAGASFALVLVRRHAQA